MKYNKFEFWVTLLLFLWMMVLAANAGDNSVQRAMLNGNPSPSWWLCSFPYLLNVVAAYTGFLALNYYVVPKYLLNKRIVEGVCLTISVVLGVGLLFMVAYSYTAQWRYKVYGNGAETNMAFFGRGIAIACVCFFFYAFYVTVREIAAYQYKQAKLKQNISSRITREVVLTFSIWFSIMLPLILLNGTGIFNILVGFFFFMLPYCFIIYFLNLYWLIPGYKQGRIESRLLYFFTLLATCVAFGLIEVALLTQTYRLSFLGYMVLYWCIPTPITIGISWWVYNSNEATYQKLTKLQTALGNTNANLQYLRSQINPHFLFNALNTLYGTALMEKADKTGEGIQKLGDMMRFMLHENNQDKIALSRELDYLHNYIDLQNMRLALSPDLVIDIRIEDIVGYYEIAPMLLIPFVENAYKHGISLQEKSWINLDLYKRDNVIHLDVRNSVHPVNLNDPEREQSGTGLANVKQRLQLMYPDRHELIIRQNDREFFIHLSLTLTTQTL